MPFRPPEFLPPVLTTCVIPEFDIDFYTVLESKKGGRK
jgi:hypothetical protein